MTAYFKGILLTAILLSGVPAFSSEISGYGSPSAFSYRSFTQGADLWQISPTGIIVFSSATNTIKRIQIEGIGPTDSILDFVENEGVLWVVSGKSLYSIDIGTSSATQIPFLSSTIKSAKIAADIDYIWLSSTDTLWRLDKLAREWTGFALPPDPASTRVPIGNASVADKIYCAYSNGLYLFSAADEKWRFFPLSSGPMGPTAFFINDADAVIALDDNRIFRFGHDAQQWQQIILPGPVIDMTWDASAYYLLTRSMAYSLAKSSWFIRPITLELLKDPWGITKSNDSTLAIADAEKTIFYTASSQSSDYIPFDGDRSGSRRIKPFAIGRWFLVRCEDGLEEYDSDTKIWRFQKLDAAVHRKRFSWNENECRLSYTPDCESSLHGEFGMQLSASARMEPDSALLKGFAYDTIQDTTTSTGYRLVSRAMYDSTLVLRPSQPTLPTSITLHTGFGKDRFLDGFFDNTNVSAVIRKGLKYSGAPNDIVNSARVLSNTFEAPKSQLAGPVTFEGASTELQSPAKLPDRDRRIVAGSAGYGKITSQTRYRHLRYNRSGLYQIADNPDSVSSNTTPVAIAPGTIHVWVDGEAIDEKEFSFSSTTGDLYFPRRDLLDNTSSILVSYQVKTRPDSGFSTLEMLPENTFGDLGYAQATVSPNSWLSMQGGYLYGRDSMERNCVNASIPLEIRRPHPEIVLLCTPEISMNRIDRAKAGALSFDSRIGKKFSLSANALMADSSFRATEGLSRGLGFLRQEYGAFAGYDILQELPVSYKYSGQRSQFGSETVHRIAAGAHFAHLPMFDCELTRSSLSAKNTFDTALAAGPLPVLPDSTRIGKDKIRLRLYETESEALRKLTRAQRIGYDASYTRYQYTDTVAGETGIGSTWYASANISPVKSCGITPIGTLNKTGPSSRYFLALNIAAVDAIEGTEFNGQYSVDLFRQFSVDSSSLDQERSATLILRPGVWLPFLKWFSPRGGISQITGYSGTGGLSVEDIVKASAPRLFGSLAENIGAHMAFGSTLLFRNDNTWVTADTTRSFATFNDLKIWPKSGMLWQTRYEYAAADTITKHAGWTRFDQRWNRLLQTMTQFDGALNSTSSTRTVLMGPQLTFVLDLAEKWWILKTLQNSHTVKIRWKSTNGIITPWSEIGYTVTLQANIFPNIILGGNCALSFNELSFSQLNSIAYIKGVF